ncbi:hypothetical protein RRG08_057856, partial [Elysia crispata]
DRGYLLIRTSGVLASVLNSARSYTSPKKSEALMRKQAGVYEIKQSTIFIPHSLQGGFPKLNAREPDRHKTLWCLITCAHTRLHCERQVSGAGSRAIQVLELSYLLPVSYCTKPVPDSC